MATKINLKTPQHIDMLAEINGKKSDYSHGRLLIQEAIILDSDKEFYPTNYQKNSRDAFDNQSITPISSHFYCICP